MNLGNYVFNLETTKIELHFEKSEYAALTDAQKKELKSNFLWSRSGNCWVSRSKEPNLYRARKFAESIGFNGEKRVGERLSYAEQIEAKTERAEARAERYEKHADNAEKRGARLQEGLNARHGDISFFTQPIIAGHAGSRAFANYREKLYNRYNKGFEEYRKSEYFRDRARTASETASMGKLDDKGYLMRQIKECQKTIRDYEKRIIENEKELSEIEKGKIYRRYDKTVVTADDARENIKKLLERVEVEMDKQAFMENRLEKLGGVTFNKENIRIGYVVQIGDSGNNYGEVISTGTQNIKYRTPRGFVLTAAYAEITKILKVAEEKKSPQPFEVGETFKVKRYDLSKSFSDPAPVHVYEIIKKTDASITVQNQTIPGEKSQILRPSQSKITAGVWNFKIKDIEYQKKGGKIEAKTLFN